MKPKDSGRRRFLKKSVALADLGGWARLWDRFLGWRTLWFLRVRVFAFSFGCDAGERLSTIAHPDSNTSTFAHNARVRLTSVTHEDSKKQVSDCLEPGFQIM